MDAAVATPRGRNTGKGPALKSSLLAPGGYGFKLRHTRQVVFDVSCRCLHTATEILRDIKVNATNVEEFVRETLGEDTCDARRSVSDPGTPGVADVDRRRPPRPGPAGPCSFDKGIASLYPQYKYRVSGVMYMYMCMYVGVCRHIRGC
jgi:hypothetical protein